MLIADTNFVKIPNKYLTKSFVSNRRYICEEMKKWLEKNNIYYEYDLLNQLIYIHDPNSMFLFRLRFNC